MNNAGYWYQNTLNNTKHDYGFGLWSSSHIMTKGLDKHVLHLYMAADMTASAAMRKAIKKFNKDQAEAKRMIEFCNKYGMAEVKRANLDTGDV